MVSGQRAAYTEVCDGVAGAGPGTHRTRLPPREGQGRQVARDLQVLRERAVCGDDARGADADDRRIGRCAPAARPAGGCRPARCAVARPRHRPAKSGRRKRASSNCRARKSRPARCARRSCKANRCPGRSVEPRVHRRDRAAGDRAQRPERQAEADAAGLCAVARPAGLGGAARVGEFPARAPAGAGRRVRLVRLARESATARRRAGSSATAASSSSSRGSAWSKRCASGCSRPTRRRTSRTSLRLCDVHGVDHATPIGATPLQLAARAGNLALVEALLEKGADPALEDEFGHSAWQQAVCRALDDPAFGKAALAPLFERIAPSRIETCRWTHVWCASNAIKASTGRSR